MFAKIIREYAIITSNHIDFLCLKLENMAQIGVEDSENWLPTKARFEQRLCIKHFQEHVSNMRIRGVPAMQPGTQHAKVSVQTTITIRK